LPGSAYTQGQSGRLELRRSREPTSEELPAPTVLAETLAGRIGRYLTRRDYLAQDAENSLLSFLGGEGGVMKERSNCFRWRVTLGIELHTTLSNNV